MSASKLDAVYRSILITKFFTKGWGKPENLRRLFEFRKVVSNREKCFKLVEKDYPVTITKEQNLADCKLLEGHFITPLERYLPGIVPEIAQKAHFQIILPGHWPDPNCKPVCLHLAGTGDHFFWRRRNLMVKPLLKEAGIGGIILENPFYGLRKPTDQVRSSLHNVSDIFVMGGCLILETLVLLHWCEQNGLGPLGVTGLSMGGHMASLAATNWPKPLVLVPCLSWSTASAVFLQGVMSHSINWDLLEDQYLSDGEYREKLSKMVTIVDEAFLAGKKFARTYSQNMESREKKTDEAGLNNLKYDLPNNNLDITYKENLNLKNVSPEVDTDVINLKSDINNNPNVNNNKSVSDNNKNAININTKDDKERIITKPSLMSKEKLENDLKHLLDDNKISKVLYDKLTSNKTFELEPNDIEEINKLGEGDIKEVLLKCNINIADIQMRHSDMVVNGKSGLKNISSSKISVDDKKDSSNKVESNNSTETDKAIVPAVEKSKVERKSWNVSDLTSDLWVNLPFLKSTEKKINIAKVHWRDREALQFMRGIMDECTHLSNFSVPFDTSLIIAVCAKHDAYVPRDDVGTLEEIWPGAEVRYVDAGHVSAYILHQSLFRSCIKEAFERSKKKWKDGKHVV